MTLPTHSIALQPAHATAKANDTTLLAVTFQIGRQSYGLPVAVVLEIVPLPLLLQLAGAPATLAGLLNLRGSYLPVLDGRTLTGQQPRYELSSQIVIVGQGRPAFGLLVDQVCDVVGFRQQLVTPIDRSAAASFIGSVIGTEGGSSVVLLDWQALMELAPQLAPR